MRFHLRLCDADPVATADVCNAYLVPLAAWLTSVSPRIDPDLCQTAAEDALLAYVQRPQAYDPRRCELGAYLRMSARSDLRNALRGEARHHRGRVAWSVVELGEEAGNLSGREEEPSLALEHREEAERWQAFLSALEEGFTPGERRVLHLMLAGERATRVFAEALGLASLPVAEQEREVKRVKDRIKNRLKRGGGTNG